MVLNRINAKVDTITILPLQGALDIAQVALQGGLNITKATNYKETLKIVPSCFLTVT